AQRGRPLDDVAAFGVIALQKVWRRIDLHLMQAGDVLAVSERLTQQSEQRDLALEAADALRVEAELEDAARSELPMSAEPHFAEPAFAKTPLEHPLRPVRHFQPCRRAPAKRVFLSHRDGTAGAFVSDWCDQRRDSLDADFEDVDGLIRSAQQVRPV